MTTVTKAPYGYYSVDPLPSIEELEEHYKKKYYQNEHSQYASSYTEEEISYFLIAPKVAEYILKNTGNISNGKLLDVGAGEGYFAKYFYENKWEVTTCDFSSFGMEQHNPSLLDTLIEGDIFRSLENQEKTKNKYDLINLSNVLEHVIDPVHLLQTLRKLLNDSSLLRIAVPNDYSKFQEMLLKRKLTTNTWYAPPEHLHYFTIEPLRNLLESLDYTIQVLMADFPIELYLLNQYSNYVKHKDVGKQAHFSRVVADNFIFDQGVDKYVNYYTACAEANLGRQLIVYASKNV